MNRQKIRIFSCLLALLSGGLLAMEKRAEVDVRSGFLARLPGLIYWAKTSDFHNPAVDYRLCIYRDRDYYLYAKDFLKHSKVAQKSIEVRFTRKLEELNQCHVSYVGEVSKSEMQSLVELSIINQTVLVASSEFSAEQGAHVRLFVGSNGQIQVEINRGTFRRNESDVTIAVLKLAKKVYDLETEPVVEPTTQSFVIRGRP